MGIEECLRNDISDGNMRSRQDIVEWWELVLFMRKEMMGVS